MDPDGGTFHAKTQRGRKDAKKTGEYVGWFSGAERSGTQRECIGPVEGLATRRP